MKIPLHLITVFIIATACLTNLGASANPVIRGVIVNSKGIPISDVEVQASGANVQYSDDNGFFQLKFTTDTEIGKKIFIGIKKQGWLLHYPVNSELIIMSPDELGVVTLIMVENNHRAKQEVAANQLMKVIAEIINKNNEETRTAAELIMLHIDSIQYAIQKSLDVKFEEIYSALNKLLPKDTVITPFEMYIEGKKAIRAKNETEALKWWYRAAEAGNVDAQDRLAAYLYENRARLNVNCREIKEWLEQSRKNGSLRSLTLIAQILFEGQCSVKDVAKAEQFLQQAVDAGYRKALFNLGVLYEHTDRFEEALKCYEQAADDEYIPAYYALGWMYYNGKGKIKKDKTLGIKLIRQAADLGYPKAIEDMNKLLNN